MTVFQREVFVAATAGVLTAAVLWVVPKFWEWPTQQLVPSKAVVAFNRSSCPPGWEPLELARGRYLVGLNKDGSPGKTVGRELIDGENRPNGQHDHPLKDASLSGAEPDGLGAGGYQRVRKTDYRTGESEGTAGIPGTNAPYVQLLYCERQ